MRGRVDFEIPVTAAGLTYRNPFVVLSGPTTMNVEQLERIQATGWGAASLKLTVDPLPYINRVPRYGYYPERDFLAFTAEKRLLLEQLLRLIEEGRRRCPELILYANITYAGDDGEEGWARMARKCESAGVHVVELNMCCPNMSFNVQISGRQDATGPRTGASMGTQRDVTAAIVAAVRKALSIPLFVKLTPEGGQVGPIAKAALEAGADAVGSTANRLGIPPVNLEDPASSMYALQKEIGMACLNGPWLKPLGLRDVYEIRRSCGPEAVITGAGGVSVWQDAIEYAMAGADLVGVCTRTITHGFGWMPEFIAGVRGWLTGHGHRSLGDVRDVLVPAITSAPDLTLYDGTAAMRDIRPAAPCVGACPDSVPAQGYVRAVAAGDFEAAFRLIAAHSPLQYACGKVCDHPCEQECVRAAKDQPVMIRAIKRFVLELAQKEGWKPGIDRRRGPRRAPVAVVGSGPAGLACAFDLARAGYRVTIFEAARRPGGMLRYGIPAYRLNDRELHRELALVKSAGAKIRCGRALGADFSLAGLLEDGFKAVFLGVGAPKGAALGLKGEGARGSLSAVEFLRSVAGGAKAPPGRRVAVIGGGFAAVDAARTALRLGATEVFLLYRRTRQEMPAAEEEVWAAEEEGVRILYLVAPLEIVTAGGKVRGVRLLSHSLAAHRDPSGRRSPVEVPKAEFVLETDAVIAATGQEVPPLGPRMTERGTVQVDEETLATSMRGVFAGGDCVLGPRSVICAIAQGRRAAASIDRLLAGKKAFLHYPPPKAAVDREAVLARHGNLPRAWRPALAERPPSERVRDFKSCEAVLTREQAVAEAKRCLACGCGAGCAVCHDICSRFAYRVDGGGRIELDQSRCVACGVCAARCPNGVIEMIRTAG